ncbi:MAG: hypothetical protein CM1200mP40_20950 [Gammaproteobacteria bacterium]|nr:MAG: hypothetical protein CM1200mP40_20950 [Gammaproteobacteria bacterium]
MSDSRCVVIGASHAGVTLPLQLRKKVGKAYQSSWCRKRVTLPPPPLSKEHLAGEKSLDAMRLRPEKMFSDNNIELQLGLTALKINKKSQLIKLNSGEEMRYDKLALCVGSIVNTIPLAGSLKKPFFLFVPLPMSHHSRVLRRREHV